MSGDMDTLPIVNCRMCGRALTWKGIGRHPSFCSRSCRELAMLARRYYRRPVAEGRGGRLTQPAS